jgi:hypothetical protein
MAHGIHYIGDDPRNQHLLRLPWSDSSAARERFGRRRGKIIAEVIAISRQGMGSDHEFILVRARDLNFNLPNLQQKD